MATLKAALILTSTDTSSDALSLSLTDSLTVVSPSISPSKITVSTTGANNIIQPNTDGHSLGVQLQASGGTIAAEYAYFTKG